MMRYAPLQIVIILLFACGPEPTFPTRPPVIGAFRMPTRQQFSEMAGRGAIDCGQAADRESAARVYQCASYALEHRRPFYCLYPSPRRTMADRGLPESLATAGMLWTLPSGFVGRSDGVVRPLIEMSRGTFTLGMPLLIPGAVPPPRPLAAGMVPPVLIAASSTDLPAEAAGVSGIVIVETVIDAGGSVTQTSVLKTLPGRAAGDAERLVRTLKFQPARFFGVPVPIIYNVTVQVSDGRATIRTPTPNKLLGPLW